MKLKTFLVAMSFVALVFSSWIVLSHRQMSLYDIDNYNCVDMSSDCKYFFESLGFDADLVYGHRYNDDGDVKAHCWVVLNLPFVSFDFESTTLSFSDVSGKYYVDWVTK